MASTNKTAYLGLNKWLSTDIPKREDFVNDNVIIDNAVKAHAEDTSLHLSAELAEKLMNTGNADIKVLSYSGSGGSLQTVALGCTPKFVIVFAAGKAPAVYENQVTKVYSSAAGLGFAGGGLGLSGSSLKAYYNKTASAGLQYCLNESGVTYIVIVGC